MKKIIKEIKSLFFLILVVLFLKETVVELYIVPTSSMEKNILRGDMLVGSRSQSLPRDEPIDDHRGG